MEGLDELDDDAAGTVFRDVILLALIGFVAMVIMLLPHVVPEKKRTEDQKAPGNVIVEMHWPSDIAADVDLWVQAPDELPVGFWNQGGQTFNLLRESDAPCRGAVTALASQQVRLDGLYVREPGEHFAWYALHSAVSSRAQRWFGQNAHRHDCSHIVTTIASAAS